jgi:shikimate 5-dehydrogenase
LAVVRERRATSVLDMVTDPPRTDLVALALTHGLVAVDGLSMLARQAAAQQRYWFDGTTSPSEAGAAPLDDAEVEACLRELVDDVERNAVDGR